MKAILRCDSILKPRLHRRCNGTRANIHEPSRETRAADEDVHFPSAHCLFKRCHFVMAHLNARRELCLLKGGKQRRLHGIPHEGKRKGRNANSKKRRTNFLFRRDDNPAFLWQRLSRAR